MKKTLIFASIMAATSAMASPFGTHQEIDEYKDGKRALANNEVKIGKYVLSEQEINKMKGQGYVFNAYTGKWTQGHVKEPQVNTTYIRETKGENHSSASPFGRGQITMGGRKTKEENKHETLNNYPTADKKPVYKETVDKTSKVPNNYPTTEEKPAYTGNLADNSVHKKVPNNYPTTEEKPAYTGNLADNSAHKKVPNNYPTIEDKPIYAGDSTVRDKKENHAPKGIDLNIKDASAISSVVMVDGKESPALDNTPDRAPDNFAEKQTSGRMGWDYRTQTTRPIRPDMGEFFVGDAIKNQSDREEMERHGFGYHEKAERWMREGRLFTDEDVLNWILEKRKNKEPINSTELGYDRNTDKFRPVNYKAGEVLVGKNIKTKEDLAEMRRYGFDYDAKERKWKSLSKNVTTPNGSRYFSDSEAYDYFVNKRDKKDNSVWGLSDGERSPEHLTIKPKEEHITAELKDSGASLMAAVLGKHYADKYGQPNNRGEKWMQENSVPLSGTEQLSCKSIMCLVAGAFGHGECKNVLKHYFSIKKIHKRIRFLKICPLRDKNKVMERVKQKELYEMGYQGKSAEQATKVNDSFISNVATKMETSCDANGLNNRIEIYRHKIDRNEYITYKRVTRNMTGYCKGLKEHYSQVVLPYYDTEVCGAGENWYLDRDFDRGYFIQDGKAITIPKTCWVDDEKTKIAQDKHIKEMSKKIMEEGLKNKLSSEEIQNQLFNLTTSEKFQIKK